MRNCFDVIKFVLLLLVQLVEFVFILLIVHPYTLATEWLKQNHRSLLATIKTRLVIALKKPHYFPKAAVTSLIVLGILASFTAAIGSPMPSLFDPENTVFYLKIGLITGTVGAILTIINGMF